MSFFFFLGFFGWKVYNSKNQNNFAFFKVIDVFFHKFFDIKNHIKNLKKKKIIGKKQIVIAVMRIECL